MAAALVVGVAVDSGAAVEVVVAVSACGEN